MGNNRCIKAYPEYQKSIEYELMPIPMVAHVVGNIIVPPPEPEPIEYNAPSGSGAALSDSEVSYESSEDDYEDEEKSENEEIQEPEPEIMPVSMVAHVVGNYRISPKPAS